MRKRIVIIVILAAVATGAWMWASGRFNRKNDRLLVSGNLELTRVDLAFKVSGRLVELAIREGDSVKKGQLIARLDRAQLEQQQARDRAAIQGAQSSYQQLVTSIEYQKATLEADVAAKRAEVNEAQARLDTMLNGSRPQDIQAAEAAVSEARAQNQQARADFERAQTLIKNEDISKQQFDQYRMRVDSTAAQLRQAEQRYSTVREGPRKEDIAGARAALARAQAAQRMSEANRLELQRKTEELGERRAEIERNRAQAGISEAQIADTTVTAPMDGVVLVKSVELGDVIAAGTTIATIGDLDHPWVRAYVNETDLGRVKLDGKVKLTTDSFPGKIYWGRISFISSEAEFTPKQIQTKEERVKLVYRIKIEVDNSSHELKNNMPVDAEIVL
jgi:HlyD family secretion protein